MTISVRKQDPEYVPVSFTLRHLKPFMDGHEVTQCIMASPEQGWCLVYDTNESGNPYVDPANPTECVTRLVFGDVKLLYRDVEVQTAADCERVERELRQAHGLKPAGTIDLCQ